jgi:hypothetical protein
MRIHVKSGCSLTTDNYAVVVGATSHTVKLSSSQLVTDVAGWDG